MKSLATFYFVLEDSNSGLLSCSAAIHSTLDYQFAKLNQLLAVALCIIISARYTHNLVLDQVVLSWFQVKASFMQSVKDLSQVMQVLLDSQPHHQDIIHVGDAGISGQTSQHVLHKPLKVAGALQSPNGMTTNSNNPEWIAKAVFSMESGAIFTCKYPDERSRVVKNFELASRSRESSTLGSRKTSILVRVFNRR